ncbi:MAG: tetratricopeptide repeat protein [Acidobacteriia bacterium]|nr:tetratricopeptide repeat protein [Terriglobia bacterium]
MVRTNAIAFIGIIAACLSTVPTATADTYWVIVRGKVTMEDGTPPPFTVAIERVCSDLVGDAPGPITNKKGEWVWRLEFDPFRPRLCVLRASHPGFISTTTEESNLNLNSRATQVTVPPLVLIASVADPYSIRVASGDIPHRVKGPFDKALKALDAHNLDEAISDLKEVVEALPKFAEGWHSLGVTYDANQKPAEARDAYSHAIEADPKQLPSYVTLTRLCLKASDWSCALKTAEDEIRMDSKHAFPEVYLHRAVAQYELKDLAAAEQSAQEAIRLDPKHKKPRTEYVLGRILEAKGDVNGAREHMMKYLELDATTKDAEAIEAHLLNLGKPAGTAPEPALELF